GKSVERDYFGSADEPASGGEARVGRLALRVWLRLSLVMPELRLGRLRRRGERFWRTSMRRLEHADSTSALDVFEEAVCEMRRGAVAQCYWSTYVAIVHARLRQLLATSGCKHDEWDLVKGSASTAELGMVAALWERAQGRRS